MGMGKIISWAIIVLAAIGGLVLILGFNNVYIFSSVSIEDNNASFNETSSYSISSTDFDSVDIKWGYGAGSVTIKPYDGDEIKITEYAQRELKKNESLFYDVKGNILTIKFSQSEIKGDGFLVSNVSIPAKKLEVLIPRSFKQKIQNLSLDMSSSEVSINEIYTKVLNIDSIVGNVELNNIHVNELILKTNEGNVILSDSSVDEATLETASGSIDLSNVTSNLLSTQTKTGLVSFNGVTSNTISFTTRSGDINFDGYFDNITTKSLSGNLKITDRIVPILLDLTTVEGDVKLAIPNTNQIPLKYETRSGHFSCAIPIILNDSEAKYNIKTSSGEIEIVSLK